jgi:hypothetical protein
MILNILSLIPTLYPIVKKVIEVEKIPREHVIRAVSGESTTPNEWKHSQVYQWIEIHILPKIKKKLDVTDDDIHTIIKFCVLIGKKVVKWRDQRKQSNV